MSLNRAPEKVKQNWILGSSTRRFSAACQNLIADVSMRQWISLHWALSACLAWNQKSLCPQWVTACRPLCMHWVYQYWACAAHWSCNLGDGCSLLLASDSYHLYCCTKLNHSFLFSKQQISLCWNPWEDSCPFFSLSDTAGEKKAPSLTPQSHIFSLCSNRPSSALWSTFPPDVFPSYVSFSLLLPTTAAHAIPPMWWLHVVMHLQAVCGIVLWVVIWQPLISLTVPWDDFFIWLPAKPVARGFRTAYKIIFHHRLQPQKTFSCRDHVFNGLLWCPHPKF